jgi:mitogen-activated protein kinase kinase kinase
LDKNISKSNENKSYFNDIKLIKGELIGKGSFGNVYKCLEEETGKLIVMKEILLQDIESKRNGEK